MKTGKEIDKMRQLSDRNSGADSGGNPDAGAEN